MRHFGIPGPVSTPEQRFADKMAALQLKAARTDTVVPLRPFAQPSVYVPPAIAGPPPLSSPVYGGSGTSEASDEGGHARDADFHPELGDEEVGGSRWAAFVSAFCTGTAAGVLIGHYITLAWH